MTRNDHILPYTTGIVKVISTKIVVVPGDKCSVGPSFVFLLEAGFKLCGPITEVCSYCNNNFIVTRLTRHEIVRLRALELEALKIIQSKCCCERR